MGFGRRKGKQQLRPQPWSWVCACASLPPPGTPLPSTLGCQARRDPPIQPATWSRARFLPLSVPYLTPVKLGRGQQPGDPATRRGDSSGPFCSGSSYRSTAPDTRRELTGGTTPWPQLESHHPALCGSLCLVTLLSPLLNSPGEPPPQVMYLENGKPG